MTRDVLTFAHALLIALHTSAALTVETSILSRATYPQFPWNEKYTRSMLRVLENSNAENGNPYIREQRVLDPVTGLYIQRTSAIEEESNWHSLIHGRGGFIAHAGVLLPIDTDALNKWQSRNLNVEHTCSETSFVSDSFSTTLNKNDHWSLLNIRADDAHVANMDSEVAQAELNTYPRVEELLFVEKPIGMLTSPGVGPDKADCLTKRVNSWLNGSTEGRHIMARAIESALDTKSHFKKSRVPSRGSDKHYYQVRPCHRLDFDTSGVIVFGLTPEAHRITSHLFERRAVTKVYVALVAGHLDQNRGIISYPVGKIPSKSGDFNEFACYTGKDDVQFTDFVAGSLRDAKTEYIVSERFSLPSSDARFDVKYTRVMLKPHTGRGHQLRLHMAALGHPILGDSLHSQSHDVSRCTPRLCLHAERMELYTSSLSAMHKDGIKTRISVESIAPF